MFWEKGLLPRVGNFPELYIAFECLFGKERPVRSNGEVLLRKDGGSDSGRAVFVRAGMVRAGSVSVEPFEQITAILRGSGPFGLPSFALCLEGLEFKVDALILPLQISQALG